jgi:hypothetical protein
MSDTKFRLRDGWTAQNFTPWRLDKLRSSHHTTGRYQYGLVMSGCLLVVWGKRKIVDKCM